MAMFKSKDDDDAMFDGGTDRMNTIIGKDTTISGTVEVTGTLRVDGVLKGDVNVSDTIAVGPTGTVEANVKTKNAVVSGAVKGNIHASERVELQAKANITGDLVTKSLVIEQGALFHGNCNMKQAATTSTPATAAVPPRTEMARPEGLRLSIPTKAPTETVEKTR
jgi:cytoskeletal protein CcmA (bactofilin family)